MLPKDDPGGSVVEQRIKRLIKTPKIHFLDSGLLAALLDLSPKRIADDRGSFGALLETFVFSEVLKLSVGPDSAFVLTFSRQGLERRLNIVHRGSGPEDSRLEVKAKRDCCYR